MSQSAFNPGQMVGGSGGGPMHYKNIKTDFGAVGDGVAEESAAFINFNGWARAQTTGVWLVIPPGSYYIHNPSTVAQWPFAGIKKLVVDGYGAIFTDTLKPNIGRQGGWAVAMNLTNMCPINSCAVGDMTVTLINVADALKFAVNTWCAISALDMQGDGSPPNPYYFEYKYINNIDPVTGIVTFSSELVNNYSAGYPQPHPAFALGGPAMLYVMHQDWDIDLLVRGAKFTNQTQVTAGGRRVVMEDCSYAGAVSTTSTSAKYFKLKNCNIGPTMEVDKVIELFEFDGCYNDEVGSGSISFQSASIEKCLMTDCRFRKINGTPKRLVARNCTFKSVQISPAGYGVTKTILLENCFVGDLIAGTSGFLSIDPTQIVNGVITLPKYPPPQLYPGTIMCSQCPSGVIAPCSFAVLNIRTDGTNLIADTTLAAGFSAPLFTGKYRFFRHPCPNFTARNCYGEPDISNQSRAPDEQPVFQYVRRLLVTNQVVGLLGGPQQLWGAWVKYRVNVIRPYTGAAATCKLQLGSSGWSGVNVDGVTLQNWNPVIDLKFAGERVITPAGNTGLVGADSVPAMAYHWGRQSIQFYLTGNTTADTLEKQAVVDIELITDQGLPDIENILFGSVASYPGL